MKTIKVKFNSKFAEQAGILFHSLELKILCIWSEDSFMDGVFIYAVLKLNDENTARITPQLQVEKLREKNYLTTIKIS